ncbi:DUF1254 domain-containing protein [Rhodococcus wratislaviensis]|uniref:DUF1254 domain-containing protein n=1 Tax=Rhodococcus wratislaviensis NBRC 100605 TaxID=1219028 RepID=X0QB53_RHOWR|nr:DUF1254 domain-containing protein [Rhodococcus wratislaviensis]GAF48837.1 hypothetical protein RW1_060_00470 [Rhodococcus wratislaviensis NBRC 100605]
MSVDRKTLESLSAPDHMHTRVNALAFTDGAPSRETVEKVYDHLDFLHGVNVYLNAFQGASTWALRQGFISIGAEDNSVVMFSELMDSQSLFLTANADTVYYVSIIDLTSGPMVVETPPMALGIFDDMWFHWIIDFGLPGPDRGEGGRFLLAPPGYDGPLPDSGFHVGYSGTNQALMLGRSFLQDDDPKPTVAVIKDRLKIYPYVPGGYGTSVATLLEGKVPPGKSAESPETRFVEASGKAFNTIPPSDFGFYEILNAMVQEQPATATDPETMGQLAAIGIVKGEKFDPDERMRKILDEAAAVGHATARAALFDVRDAEGVRYYPDSAWTNMLFPGGYTFETPPPLVTEDGIKPFPPGGAKKLNVRTLFFFGYTGISPAMCMRLTGIGSQYLVAFRDTDDAYFDGAKTYKMSLPPDIPAARFWSITLYDNQTRSMLQTPQRFPRAGSQSYPTPAADAEADGSTTIHIAPEKPDGVGEGNWIQTDPDKGFFVILRLYSPLASYFDKTWKPGEIDQVR